jgi:hypothetical protein
LFTPFFCARQLKQGALQAWSQHTPSAQNPLLHCWFPVQGSPAPSKGEHFPVLQKKPDTHPASSLQAVGQMPLRHR